MDPSVPPSDLARYRGAAAGQVRRAVWAMQTRPAKFSTPPDVGHLGRHGGDRRRWRRGGRPCRAASTVPRRSSKQAIASACGFRAASSQKRRIGVADINLSHAMSKAAVERDRFGQAGYAVAELYGAENRRPSAGTEPLIRPARALVFMMRTPCALKARQIGVDHLPPMFKWRSSAVH